MKLGKSVHPPLFAAFPVLCVFSANLDLIPLPHLWRPLAVALSGGIGLWIVATLAWRDSDKGAVTASVVALSVYGFAAFSKTVMPHEDTGVQVAVWAVLALGLGVLAGWKVKWVGPVNVLASGCVLTAIGQICITTVTASHYHVAANDGGSSVSASAARPDIVNIILDGYGRSDQLKRAIGFSNDPFIKGLRDRGFFVADQAHSNYCQTELSIASSLNMDTIQSLVPNMGPKSNERNVLIDLLGQNAVQKRLKKLGYRFITVTSGFPPIRFDSNDLHLADRENMTWFESAVLQTTPFGPNPITNESMVVERRRHIHDAYTNIEQLALPSTTPRFIVAHILAPHPPFVFNADGSPRPRKKGAFGYWDGSDFLTYVGNADDYKSGYAAQAEYIDTLTLKAIDKLLATRGVKPVIVVQGDHGSKVGLDQNSLERTDLKECMSNLCAIYGPPAVKAKLYPQITPVNYFRVVLDGLFGDNLPLLPDKSYYSTYPLPYAFTDVSDQLSADRPGVWKQ